MNTNQEVAITTIQFEFRQYQDSWPICIAKVEDTTLICLECHPFISSYASECGDLIQQWFCSLSYPECWEIVFDESYFALKNLIAEERKKANMESLHF